MGGPASEALRGDGAKRKSVRKSCRSAGDPALSALERATAAASGRNLLAKAHKNPDFVLEKPENRGFGGQKRTKMPILCSGSQKMGVWEGKSAQKPRFCARNARKQGFQRAKKHKNPDFVLERPENGGLGGKKRTKMPILCSGGANSWEKLRIILMKIINV